MDICMYLYICIYVSLLGLINQPVTGGPHLNKDNKDGP